MRHTSEHARPKLSSEQWFRLRLIRTRHIGSATYHQLLHTHGTAEKAHQWLIEHKSDTLALASSQSLKQEVDLLRRLGGCFLWHDQAEYPALLRQIPHAPAVLAAVGNLECLNYPTVSLVGARNASHNGLHIAETLATDLAAAGMVTVSGMARGIDAAVHRASRCDNDSLETKGTIAVLAGGIDVPYPPENTDLYQTLVDGSGLVISEMPLGLQPQARLFPRRNRIIAGLSRMTVVIESSPRSGSIITASLAADYGREVGAVPGSPLDTRNLGAINLLRQGAHIITQAQDICRILADMPTTELPIDKRNETKPRTKLSEPLQSVEKAMLRKTENNPAKTNHNPLDKANLHQSIMAYIGSEPCRVDVLLQALPHPESTVLSCLGMLEIDGIITRFWDNRVMRKVTPGYDLLNTTETEDSVKPEHPGEPPNPLFFDPDKPYNQ